MTDNVVDVHLKVTERDPLRCAQLAFAKRIDAVICGEGMDGEAFVAAWNAEVERRLRPHLNARLTEERLWEIVDSLYDGLTAARERLRAHEEDEENADLDRLIEGIGMQRAALIETAPAAPREVAPLVVSERGGMKGKFGRP